jgi:dTDP-4-dehydrorhamnose 3,5-epimerase
MADDTIFNNAQMVIDECFYSFNDDPRSAVIELTPKVFSDSRGWFSEVLKGDLAWIKQINRSSSSANVVRGCHAQKGEWCQAKLVEAVTEVIFDYIIDARPDSKTFGVSKIFRLDPIKQNKLFVPRGFLHAFIVPKNVNGNAVFTYYCDNTYNKSSEICINPQSIIPRNIGILRSWCRDNSEMNTMFHELIESSEDDWIYSEKDLQGIDYDTWMTTLKMAHDNGDFKTSLWYK